MHKRMPHRGAPLSGRHPPGVARTTRVRPGALSAANRHCASALTPSGLQSPGCSWLGLLQTRRPRASAWVRGDCFPTLPVCAIGVGTGHLPRIAPFFSLTSVDSLKVPDALPGFRRIGPVLAPLGLELRQAFAFTLGPAPVAPPGNPQKRMQARRPRLPGIVEGSSMPALLRVAASVRCQGRSHKAVAVNKGRRLQHARPALTRIDAPASRRQCLAASRAQDRLFSELGLRPS